MASAKSQVPALVFVFLDENVSRGRVEKLKSAKVPSKYKLEIIPFPKDMERIAIFDFQVVFHLKKRILNRCYGIHQLLYRNPRPIFIFLTADKKFISDAKDGFEIWIKLGNEKKRRRYVNRIKLSEGDITFSLDNGYIVNVAKRLIKGGEDDTQQMILDKMMKSLEEFLKE